jgi:cell division protein ZapD
MTQPPNSSSDPTGQIFEHPLNERMRGFLRLEFLFNQLTHYRQSLQNPAICRAAMLTVLDLQTITSRNELKNELIKELEKHINVLREFQSRRGVDVERLNEVLGRLSSHRDKLYAINAQDLARVRDGEFLAAIRLRMNIPGGTCEFDLPEYAHWLNLPVHKRLQDVDTWLDPIRPLGAAASDLLWVTRENARPREEIAQDGSHHISFERESPIQLLRITLPAESTLYPQISGSHHRCSIRFMEWHSNATRGKQAEGSVKFWLTRCT